MKKHSIHILIFVFAFFNASLLFSQNDEWSVVSHEDDIIVSTRYTEDNPIKEVKIYATIDANSELILESLSNVELYKQWVYRCKESFKIEEIGEQEFIYYSETELPGLFSNRDLVLHSRQYEDNQTGLIYSVSECVPEHYEEIEDNVRIKKFKSEWRIRPVGSQQTEIEYLVSMNPGGYLPAWLVNLGVSSGPLKTMQNFKNLLED